MTPPTTTQPASGVVVRSRASEHLDFPDGSTLQLLVDGGPSELVLSAHRAQLCCGAEAAGPHHHDTTTEVIYVLAGAVIVLVGDEVVEATAGDLVVIPPRVIHAFAAPSTSDADIFDLTTPGLDRFDFFRAQARVANGLEAASSLRDQSQYDTYADDSPVWRGRTTGALRER